jgi:hypothetical protein
VLQKKTQIGFHYVYTHVLINWTTGEPVSHSSGYPVTFRVILYPVEHAGVDEDFHHFRESADRVLRHVHRRLGIASFQRAVSLPVYVVTYMYLQMDRLSLFVVAVESLQLITARAASAVHT